MKNIAILGCTGSIGCNSLRVIEALGEDYRVVALTAHNNIKLLARQVEKYRPQVVALTNREKFTEFKALLPQFDGEILAGTSSLITAAELPQVDIVISAVVGAAGLDAALSVVKKGKILAVANKEPLVIAGELLTATAKKTGATILPIDSEHSAVFQAMQAGDESEVNRIILTASGGPFRGATIEQIQNVTIDEALAHPTWSMGAKITIDSATMINKALEVIEAKWLFDIDVEKIDVLVHPESIVHSLVEFVDGSVIAQMSSPDMCLPIQYALTYPKRVRGITPHLRLDELGSLTFEKPDMKVFRGLALGFEAARAGGTAAAVFNAANEQAVKEFLEGNIKFAMIVEAVEHCLSRHIAETDVSLKELLNADLWARNEVNEWLTKQKV